MSRVTYLIPLSTKESSLAFDFATLSALIVVSLRATKRIAHDASLILAKSPDVRWPHALSLSSETGQRKFRFRSLSYSSLSVRRIVLSIIQFIIIYYLVIRTLLSQRYNDIA